MKCPFCGHLETQVLESRIADDGSSFRRRRECEKCRKRFTTYERAEKTLLVVKKDGRRESFDRDKIKKGILLACHKRPVSAELIDSMVDEVEQELLRKDSAEIPTRTVGNAVLKRLKKVDKVAWLRFASVYLEFENLEDFEKAIERNS
ncbi:transcriptional regulator NrdR [Candidatus Shapirobacteria bacterium CG08_land_8_20_14_0_20_39_18]|uniref:Transcriptional repressor NrdR n=1 Tax=Candidatus Shapirobacteria bacterium CG08_land_8_20_14_0_20_39_18 TaxID=1974883 RepID=A0A2M6XDH0_9BACT|nr:MAG: transcriptional regulator NrdR [Candidatus Shapirobacteria bacterium CG08_land_8_20_14_0_20_39_18]PIY64787.1 MAG: transcriptional regulator NrdR [Candidatus Shapirobacteria bacterium CG_4_10_14_0_8_um_filter_39_15]PJE67914.1 MAG: transcriptional regulator NrdR [Candidatus Shapirobacteria bacterium CG10_big_fil_rev_8_21_14_0_10_38_8]